MTNDRAPAVTVSETGDGKFTQDIIAGRHRLIADEPTVVGGDDAGPAPYDLLLAALGACTSMTLRMYAARKDMALDKVDVRLWHSKIHAEDCAECETKDGKIDRIDREIILHGVLTEAEVERLTYIADRCPVHQSLTRDNQIVTDIAHADAG